MSVRPSPPARASRLLSAGIVVAAIGVLVVGLPIQVALGTAPGDLPVFLVVFPALILSLTVVGEFVVYRVPTNAIGWLLEIAGLTTAIAIFGGTYVQYAQTTSRALPLVVPLAWLSSWLFVTTLGILAIYVPLLFPTGTFLSARWRVVGGIGAIGATASAAATAFAPGPLSDAPWISNPFGIPAATGLLAVMGNVGNGVAPFLFVAAMASLVVRFRRAGTLERQQLKWFGFVASIAVIGLGLAVPNDGPIADAGWAVGLSALAALPAAIGLAILRYRLWDIDRIVSRTVAYAIVTGILALTFAVAVVAFDGLLAPITGKNGLAVAASTLLVAGLFQSVRRRTQAGVDRRFDRRRVDAAHTVAAFSAGLREETDLASIGVAVDRTVRGSVAPVSVALWVRERDGAGGHRQTAT